MFFPFFLSDLDLTLTMSFQQCKLKSETEWRKTTFKANPFINNRGWEQRLNAPNTQQKAALGTAGSSKWRCWNIKNFRAQKFWNMFSVNCKEQRCLLPSHLACEVLYRSVERVKRSHAVCRQTLLLCHKKENTKQTNKKNTNTLLIHFNEITVLAQHRFWHHWVLAKQCLVVWQCHLAISCYGQSNS